MPTETFELNILSHMAPSVLGKHTLFFLSTSITLTVTHPNSYTHTQIYIYNFLDRKNKTERLPTYLKSIVGVAGQVVIFQDPNRLPHENTEQHIVQMIYINTHSFWVHAQDLLRFVMLQLVKCKLKKMQTGILNYYYKA